MNLAGRKLGKYEIIERLGRGGMAEVYRAFQPGVEREVAVKVMHGHLADSEDFIARFRREAQSIGRLQHPNIVRIIDFDVEADLYYMVMDFIPGGTLEEYLADRQKVLPVAEAVHLTRQLAEALVYAHGQGMIHRDIKPGNIMFQDQACTHPVLTDFGIARLLDEASSKLTMTGALVGTPTYMSPEAAQGEPCDERADIYSLGVVLYQMVAGRPPYVAETPYSLMMQQANEPIPPLQEFNPQAPKAVADILHTALAKDPNERFQSAAELADALADLEGAPAASTGGPRRASTRPGAPRPAGQQPTNARRRMLLAGAGIGVLLIAVMTAFLLTTMSPDPATSEAEPTVPATATVAVQAAVQAAAPTPIQATPDSEDGATEASQVSDGAASTPTADTEEEPPAPTEAPAVELAASDDVAPVPDRPRFLGDLTLQPDDRGAFTRFRLMLDPVRLPPAGFHYALWLTSQDDNRLYLGPLESENGRVEVAGEASADLLSGFERAIIGLEKDGDQDVAFSASAVYESVLPDPVLTSLRALLQGQDQGPGLLAEATDQAEIAALHAGFLQDALAANDMTAVRRHTEHVVNILVGEGDDLYGDLDRDGTIENPASDSVGVLPRLAQAVVNLETLAADAPDPARAATVLANSQHAHELTLLAKDKAMQIIAADTTQEAQPKGDELALLLDQMLHGRDLDQNGTVDPMGQEGGLLTVSGMLAGLARFPFMDHDAGLIGDETLVTVPDSVGRLQLLVAPAAPTPAPVTPPAQTAGGSSDSGEEDGYGGYGGSSSSRSGTPTPEPLLASRFRLTMNQVEAPSAGFHYELWLVGSQTDTARSLGTVLVETGTATLEGRTDYELLVGFDQAQLRLVANGDPSGAGTVAYTGIRPEPLQQALNRVLVLPFEDRNTPFEGAITELHLANLHTGFLQDELDKEDLSEAQRHAEHVLNILSGKNGEFFGDPDGDGIPQNPGDGVGAITYLLAIEEEMLTLLDSTELSPEAYWLAEEVFWIVQNTLDHVTHAEETALRVFAADTAAEVQSYENSIRELLLSAQQGQDQDANGVIDPWAGEGGTDALLEFFVRMGAYSLVKVE